MPAAMYAITNTIVKPMYTPHNRLAVWRTRGVSRSPVGPGASASSKLMPPEPTVGSTATTNTITPIPPIHCVVARQNNTPGPVPSIGRKTVAPVVVNPEIDSNIASSNAGIQPVNTNGRAPTTISTTHANVTVTNTSRIRIWRGSLVNRQATYPTTVTSTPIVSSTTTSGPPRQMSTSPEATIPSPATASVSPTTCPIRVSYERPHRWVTSLMRLGGR